MTKFCRRKGLGHLLSPIQVALSLRNEEVLNIPLQEVELLYRDGNLFELRIDGGLPRLGWLHSQADITSIFDAYRQWGDAGYDPNYKILKVWNGERKLLTCPSIFYPGESFGGILKEDFYRQEPECVLKHPQDFHERRYVPVELP
ncbi:hypothetical protein QVA66_08885 [Staphylococcus chromogenes]|nr:hypothetical protein [Staphylococcus chromogenes]